MRSRFRGLVAAPFTPLQPDRSLHLEVIPAYARLLARNGVAAAFIGGTTGESASLTQEERLALAEQWIRSAGPDLPIIVHVGHSSLADARALAAQAERLGAAAIAAVAPYFFKPRDPRELVAWCEALAAAAPSLPFYYYHIPSMTGVSLPMREFLAQAAARIPSLAGVKYTHEDLNDYEACVQFADGRYDVLFGRDELLLEGWSRGARGAVGSTYNYAAPLYHRLLAAHEAGDAVTARQWQDRAIQMISLCAGTDVTHLAMAKSLMATIGLDCGPTRLPLAPPTRSQREALLAQLAAIGFPEFACQSEVGFAVS